MPSVVVYPALWARLTIIAAESGRTIEDLIDELLSAAVMEMESRNG